MLDPAGGFYSAQDADSEGEEGKFFVWTKLEIDQALGPDLGALARAYFGVTEAGNFEGRNILSRPRDDEDVAAEFGMGVEALRARIEDVRAKLLETRDRRVHPERDDKILTSWNALMLAAFAEAGAIFDEPRYVDVARLNAAFLLENLVRDGRLLRTWKDGQAKLNAYLEDYAYLVAALLKLYEATFEERWLREGRAVADSMIELFWDDEKRLFFDTGSDHERLVVRPRDVFDNATPSGGSAAALALLRLAAFTGENNYERYAVETLRSVRELMVRAPSGFAHWLAALDFYLSPSRELAIVGLRSSSDTQSLLRTVHERYLPNHILAGADAPQDAPASPLLEGRDLAGGRAAAYVCENYVCQLPVTTPEELAAQLDGVAG
jgi:uncharacterized protein YyaL (SSP411 family)